jgi:hypothetical protein
MPQDDDPDNGEEQTFETHQGSAGFPQRPIPPDSLGLSGGFPETTTELTPEELDARQAAIGGRRRDGPPLPEGEEDADPSALAFGTEETQRQVEPTEVKEAPDD